MNVYIENLVESIKKPVELNGDVTIGYLYTKKNINFDSYLIPRIKTKSKQVRDLNIKLKIINVLEESIGDHNCDPRLGKDFLDMVPNA